MEKSRGKEYGQLNQQVGAFNDTLRSMHREVISQHEDKVMFEYLLKRLLGDFNNLVSQIKTMEQITFINRKGNK
jgi:hypothetical protein